MKFILQCLTILAPRPNFPRVCFRSYLVPDKTAQTILLKGKKHRAIYMWWVKTISKRHILIVRPSRGGDRNQNQYLAQTYLVYHRVAFLFHYPKLETQYSQDTISTDNNPFQLPINFKNLSKPEWIELHCTLHVTR